MVNPWALPLQKPHPPVMVPGTASPETVIWAAKHRYPYVVLGSSLDQTKELIELYRETAAEEGYEMGPEHIGYLIRVLRRGHGGEGAGRRATTSSGRTAR